MMSRLKSYFNAKNAGCSEEQLLLSQNFLGSKTALKAMVEEVAAMDDRAFYQAFPLARRAFKLKLELALAGGLRFAEHNAPSQKVLAESGFMAAFMRLIDPEETSCATHGLLFNRVAGRFQLAPLTQAGCHALAYRPELSLATKRRLVQYDLATASLFDLAISASQTVIEFDKDSDLGLLEEMMVDLKTLAREATSQGLTFLKGASMKNIEKSSTSVLAFLAEIRTLIASETGYPVQILFEEHDSSSVFSGKTNSQYRFENEIIALQNGLLKPFCQACFAEVFYLKDQTFYLSRPFGYSHEQYEIYLKMAAEVRATSAQLASQQANQQANQLALEEKLTALKHEIFGG